MGTTIIPKRRQCNDAARQEASLWRGRYFKAYDRHQELVIQIKSIAHELSPEHYKLIRSHLSMEGWEKH